MQHTFTVGRSDHEKRIDLWLTEALNYKGIVISRSALQRLLASGKVTKKGVEGPLKSTPKEPVTWEEEYTVEVPDLDAAPAKPVKIAKKLTPSIIFENDDLLVINKPAGLTVHPARAGHVGTLMDWILMNYPALEGIGEDPLRPGIVHRLDKETSGVMLITKTQAAFDELKAKFQDRTMHKTYRTLVHGTTDQTTFTVHGYLERVKASNKRRLMDHETHNSRYSETHFEVVKRYGDVYTELLATPKTGRTHQLRAHLASLQMAILGDEIYTPVKWQRVEKETKVWPDHQLLHAERIWFQWRGIEHSYEAPIPGYFVTVQKRLDGIL